VIEAEVVDGESQRTAGSQSQLAFVQPEGKLL